MRSSRFRNQVAHRVSNNLGHGVAIQFSHQVDAVRLRRLHADAQHRGDFGGHTLEDIVAATPVRRIGRPEDIAATCAFLVSDDASYITGQIIGVNGGRNT